MSQTDPRLFDDLAKMAGGALQALSGLKEQLMIEVRERVDSIIANMDLVTREEFDAVQAMAAKARLEQTALLKRIDALEKKLKPAKAKTKPKTKSKAKTAAKKTAAKPKKGKKS